MTSGQRSRVSRPRLLCVLFGVLFVVSVTILLIASAATEPVPLWGGIVDVIIAVALAILGLVIRTIPGASIADRNLKLSYAIAIHLPVAMLILMWLFARQLDWNILLPGLAWRLWLLLYSLPAALTILRDDHLRAKNEG